MNQKRRAYYQLYLKTGKCWTCGRPRGKKGSKTLCHTHLLKARKAAAESYARQARKNRGGAVREKVGTARAG